MLTLLAIATAIGTLPVQAQTGGFDRTMQVFGAVNLDVSSGRLAELARNERDR